MGLVQEVDVNKPDKLDDKGSLLWDDVTGLYEFDPAGYQILEDICRTVDIIDRLTRKIKAPHHEWVRMVEDLQYHGDGTKVLVVVDSVLTEIRQQRLALLQQWKHLNMGKVVVKGDAEEGKSLWAAMEAEFAKPGPEQSTN